MNGLISKKHFVCSDIEKNANRFWIGELYDNHKVILKHGRVGYNQKVIEKNFDSQDKAEKFFNAKVKDKQKVKTHRDSYTEIQVIEGAGSINRSVSHVEVEDIALGEINTNTKAAKDFIKWLCKINKHNILTNTTIQYDISSGSFRTPLGIIDKSCLDNARKLLDQIEPFIAIKDYDNKQLVRLINQYLRFIPQDLGGSNVKIRIKDILPNIDAVQKQSGLIDSLNASIGTVKPVEKNECKIFDTSVFEIEDLEPIKKYYKRPSPRINRAYEIHITSVKEAWEQHGVKKGNIVKTWHGTDPGNALSILRQGLVIPKNYTNGRAYGHGIYMTESPDTPISYAWERDGKRLMFHMDAALGKTRRDSGSVREGDDSLYVPGCGYIIIPRVSQINLLYLVEFS